MCFKNLEFSKFLRLFELLLCSKYFLSFLISTALGLRFYNFFHRPITKIMFYRINKRRKLCTTPYFTYTQKGKAGIISIVFTV
jgi:hypothetical protein